MKYLLIIIAVFVVGAVAYSQNKNETSVRQNNADFAKTITHPNIQLVDVRTSAEYAEGHIPGAINIDITGAMFDKQIATLDSKRPVAVYCRSGNRSKIAARKLALKGFKVYELDKGFNKWAGKTEK